MTDNITALFVDSNAASLSKTTASLEELNERLTLLSETDPTAALERIRRTDIDCLISAYELPELNGVEFLSRVRDHSPTLPFILYTDAGSEQVASEAISAGVSEYVQKSGEELDYETLAARILSVVEAQPGSQQSSKQTRIAQLVRNVQKELVSATTPKEVDTAVCDALAGADPFVFAWIGDYTTGDNHVQPRTAAGIGLDYPEEIEISFDENTAEHGPTARAIETRSMQVVQNIPEDPAYERWRESALERGYRSSAAVPLTYNDTFYGVLNIYADRRLAFGDAERELLHELSRTAAHTYHRIHLQEDYNQQYRELFTEAPVMFVLTREDNGTPIIDDCNPQFAEKVGYTRTELTDRSLADVYTESSTQALLDGGGYTRALEGNLVKQERELLTSDGKTLSTLMRAAPRRNAEGEIIGTLVLYVDVTARQRAQDLIRQGRAMESSIDGMAILDADHQHIYANQAYADAYGFDNPAALEGEGWELCYQETEREQFADEVLPSLETTGQWRGETTGVRRDGTTFPQELSLTRVDDGSLIAVVRDVTDRKRRGAEVKQSRERLRVLFDESPDAITVHDSDGEVIDVNDQLVDDLGYSREQLHSMNIADFEVALCRAELLDNLDEMAVGDTKKAEGTHRRKDGSTFPVEVWLNKIELDGRERFVALSRNITERKEREQELERTNTVLSTLLENLPVGVLAEDGDREIIAANQALCEIFGIPNKGDALVGRDCEQASQEVKELFEKPDAFIDRIEELLDRRETVLDEELNVADGRTLARSFVPYQLPAGNGNLWLYRDITDRTARERELERQEFLFDRVQDIADIGVWEYDPNAEELMWSDGVRQIHAVDETYDPTLEDAIEFYHPDDRDGIRTAIDGAIEDGDQYDIDLRLVRADGQKRDVRSRGEVTTDEHGDTELVRGVFQDVTERKQRERELKRYQAFVENSSDVITVLDPEGTVEYVSSASRDVSGHEPEELIGTDAFEHVHPDDRDKMGTEIAELLEEPESTQTSEYRFKRADGSWAWIETTAVNRLADDEIEGLVLVSRNVTERKRREQKLQELTQQYNALFQNADESIFLIDVDTTGSDVEFRYERLNPSHEAATGRSTASVRGQTPQEVLGEDLGSDVEANYRRCVEARDSISYEKKLPMPEGESIWQTSLTPVIVGGELTQVVGISRDITERKKRERALERYERIVESLPIGVYQITPSPHGEFTLLNDAMVDIFDAESKDDLRNCTVEDLYVDPANWKRFSEMLLQQGEIKSEELELETLSGEQLWGEVTAITREVDGDTVFDGAVQNITARKAYEQQLETQRDNLDVLNQVVRHDIRNDLQLVLVYGDLLTDHVDEEGQEHLQKVLESSKNAVELTETARDMADIMVSADENQHPVGLRHVLEGELDETRSVYSDALITIDGRIPNVAVCADDMLGSVFRNLLKNAVQHSDKETPKVTVSVTEREETVLVSIADNGPGVPDELKDDIFGKSEKGLESEGTGIGLYLVQTLVDSYDGDIRVEDNDPDGAVFVVELLTAN